MTAGLDSASRLFVLSAVAIAFTGCSPRMERAGDRSEANESHIQSAFELKVENEPEDPPLEETTEQGPAEASAPTEESTKAPPTATVHLPEPKPQQGESLVTITEGGTTSVSEQKDESPAAPKKPTKENQSWWQRMTSEEDSPIGPAIGVGRILGSGDFWSKSLPSYWGHVGSETFEILSSVDFWTSLPGEWWKGATKASDWALVQPLSNLLFWADSKWKDRQRGPHFSTDLELSLIATEDGRKRTFKFGKDDPSVGGSCLRVSKDDKHFILAMIGRKSATGRYFNRGSDTLMNDQTASLVLQFAHRTTRKPLDQRFGIVDFRYQTLEEGKDVKMPDPFHKTGMSKQTMVYVDHDIDLNREQLDAQEVIAEGASLDGRYMFQLKGQLKCKFTNNTVEI